MVASQSASLPPDDLSGKAIDLLRRGVFPGWWHFVPVSGKETYVEKWSSAPLTAAMCVEAYKARQCYRGVGVVTGKHSMGLIALDIDGPNADERYKAEAGAEYEAYGEEKTMSWTSGRPGRRQIVYQLPEQIIDELEEISTVILRKDGSWYKGNSDVERQGAKQEQGVAKEGEAAYEEVVLRFNACQSVLPGSPHPDTGGRYRFLNYNGGRVA